MRVGTSRDRAEELLALRRVDLLRVVQEAERPDSVVVQALVVQEHACGDERPGQAAAAGLVRARRRSARRGGGRRRGACGPDGDGRHGREDSA